MILNYVVKFRSNFGKWENIAGRELVKGHNRLADLCDENYYKKLNSDFNSLYPDIDTGDEGEGFAFYNKFANERVMREVVEPELNRKLFSPILKYALGEEHNLIGISRLDPKKKIEFFLVPKE